jgi:hypothetical protein
MREYKRPKIAVPDRSSARVPAPMDGIAIVRSAPRKQLGCSYRKRSAVKSPDALMEEEYGYKKGDDLESLG